MSIAVRMPEHVLASRQRFISDLRSVAGTGVRALYMPKTGEGSTTVDGAVSTRVWTHANTPVGRLSSLGRGTALSFNGTSDFLTCPDAADMSFTTGGMGIFAVVRVTDTAAQRNIIAKFDVTGTIREWSYAVSVTDFQETRLYLESTDHPSFRTTDATVTQGSWTTIGTTVGNVAGGATAGSTMVMYQAGAAVASTATEDAAFTAPEDTTSIVWIGAQSATPANFFAGSMALVLVAASAFTAAQHFQFNQLARRFFGI